MAGPVLIFDKSTLQSLNVDESLWLDNSYLSNITPLFFVETLADLEKEPRPGRTPEQIVGNLAEKTPDMGSSLNAHHHGLIIGELLGIGKIDLRTGRPHLAGGKPVELQGRSGVMFGPSPEEEAFHRWQNGEFLEVERQAAKAWRRALGEIDLDGIYALFKERLPQWNKPKNLDQVKVDVNTFISNADQENVLRMGLAVIGILEEVQRRVLERWQAAGRPAITEFAPYFTYVFSVDLFFYFGIAADLIGRGRASHKVDIAYLYYLPFCMVFSSNDKLHATLAPFFMRPNQTFVSGIELKADLQALDRHYDALSDEEKDRGIMSFAFYPPDDSTFLLTRLWDQYMNPGWREHKQDRNMAPYPREMHPDMKSLMDEIREKEKGSAPMKPLVSAASTDEPDQIVVKRTVRARRGRWERFPPEVRNRPQNADGEFEDIPPDEGEK